MKTYIQLLLIALVICLIEAIATAQVVSNKVIGTLEINYNSRVTAGKSDTYKMDITVCNSARFYGGITNRPIVVGTFGGVSQESALTYGLVCDVINPENVAQMKPCGRLYGRVPVSMNGEYNFTGGDMTISVVAMNRAPSFDSRFGGTALGRPLIKKKGFFEAAAESINLSKLVNGKPVTLKVSKYDKMQFNQHVLAAGPVSEGTYPSSTVNGEMLYDYNNAAWHFRGLSVVYQVKDRMMADRLTGNIRWVESANRKTSGEGYYEFDVRVNEPPVAESAAFSGATTSESSFFEVDNNVAALTGQMRYKDAMSTTGNVLASGVKVDLTGNKLNKLQIMNLCKLILISAIVPLNAE